jgi:hypothetical protein
MSRRSCETWEGGTEMLVWGGHSRPPPLTLAGAPLKPVLGSGVATTLKQRAPWKGTASAVPKTPSTELGAQESQLPRPSPVPRVSSPLPGAPGSRPRSILLRGNTFGFGALTWESLDKPRWVPYVSPQLRDMGGPPTSTHSRRHPCHDRQSGARARLLGQCPHP